MTETDDAPDTVNPSLWRMAKLNMIHGLFEVVDGIWQARGYDLSVMSIIRTNTGYIVIDPFISPRSRPPVWQELVIPKLGDKPVVAVIHTHSHVDHYGGVRTFVTEADLAAGKVKVLAPEDFTRAAVSENVIAGNAMSRRASYMYGNLVGKSPTGQVDGGLGKTTSTGTIGLVVPTDHATKTGQTITIDGIDLNVIMAPESEAPAEFMFYIPKYKAFCAAEDACIRCTISTRCAARRCVTACCGRNTCSRRSTCSAATCRWSSHRTIGRPGAMSASSLAESAARHVPVSP